MTVLGQYTKRAGERTAKEEGVAIREARRKEMQVRDSLRAAMYRLDALMSAAQGAESKLADVVALHDRRAADVAGMREEAAETGRLHPGLPAAVATLNEFPAIIARARARAEVARAAYDAEIARQAPASVEVVEVEPEAVAVPEAPRGRGRPAKSGAN